MSGSDSDPPKGKSCFVILFGLVFMLAGGGALLGGLTAGLKPKATKGWVETPCVVERFEITADHQAKLPFQADLAFRYEVDGKSFTGTRLASDASGSDDYEDLGRAREKLLMQGVEGPLVSPAGAAAKCYVNPANPAEAVLQKKELSASGRWGAFIAAIFGSIFLLVGLVILRAGVFGSREGGSAKPRVRSDSGKDNPWLAAIFLSAFALAGTAMGSFVLYKVAEWIDMRRWVVVPGQVIWSEVKSHSSDDGGDTYSVDLFYRYDYAGRTYHGSRSSFMGGSSSGSESKERFVEEHPPGSEVALWVNPKDPWSATAERDVGLWGLFGLFPLPFLAVGYGGIWWSLKKGREQKAGKVVSAASAGKESGFRPKRGSGIRAGRSGVMSMTTVLQSGQWSALKQGGIGMLIFLFIFGAFWNGMIWGFGVPRPSELRASGFEWVRMIFMIPFIVIGLGIVVGFFYGILVTLGPVYEIRLDSAELEPGRSTRATWRRRGGRGQPRKLTLLLVGKEEATYSQGSSNSTASSVFHESVLYQTTSPLAMTGGTVEMVIPPGAVPSLEGENNCLRWLICLRCEIRPWFMLAPEGRFTVVAPPVFSPIVIPPP